MDYLTSIDQLNPGKKWPPDPDITKRIRALEDYQKAFSGKHDDIYKEQYQRVSRVIGNFDNIIQYSIMLNYQKKISLKIADLLLGERPNIRIENESDQDRITNNIKNSDFWNTLYEAILDTSRFGNGILMIYNDDGIPKVDVIPAKYWIPIVDPNNIKKIINHAIVWTIKEGKDTNINIQIHYKGYYINRLHRLIGNAIEGSTIGPIISEDIIYTNLSDFAIVPLSNVTSSDSIYGISDYDDVDSIISELEVRISQVSRILDKHADPSIVIPESSVEVNEETGETKVRLGNAFILSSKEDVKPEYITFDGQLDPSFKAIEALLTQLAIISELGTLFLGNGIEAIGNISGIALKKLAYSALAKISRIQKKVEPSIIKVLSLLSELSGSRIDDISITWSDSLPTDLMELVKIANARTGDKPTMSQSEAIKFIDDADDSKAQEMIDEISKEGGGNGDGK